MARSRRPADRAHGLAGYRRGCRCPVCENAAWSAEQRAKGLPVGDPRHGSVNGYTGWGCRCGACRTAHTEASRSSFFGMDPTARRMRRLIPVTLGSEASGRVDVVEVVTPGGEVIGRLRPESARPGQVVLVPRTWQPPTISDEPEPEEVW